MKCSLVQDNLAQIAILADKGTIKHDTLQLTLIRILCLKKGVLFERFFIGNPEVVNHGGFNITGILINTVCDTLDITREVLRQRLTVGSFDGQHIHLNVMKHFSEALSLPLQHMKDSITHDAAHRL